MILLSLTRRLVDSFLHRRITLIIIVTLFYRPKRDSKNWKERRIDCVATVPLSRSDTSDANTNTIR